MHKQVGQNTHTHTHCNATHSHIVRPICLILFVPAWLSILGVAIRFPTSHPQAKTAATALRQHGHAHQGSTPLAGSPLLRSQVCATMLHVDKFRAQESYRGVELLYTVLKRPWPKSSHQECALCRALLGFQRACDTPHFVTLQSP